MTDVIRATGLVKTYGQLRALDGLDLAVPEGTVLGLLGPNGAGKTTAVRILTTILRPDAGSAHILGVDVARHPDRLSEARALGPVQERQVFGRSILLFDGVERARLAALGEVRTPGIADLFVAVMGARPGPEAGAAR